MEAPHRALEASRPTPIMLSVLVDPINKVCPSGFELVTAPAPTMPAAPGRFSTSGCRRSSPPNGWGLARYLACRPSDCNFNGPRVPLPRPTDSGPVVMFGTRPSAHGSVGAAGEVAVMTIRKWKGAENGMKGEHLKLELARCWAKIARPYSEPTKRQREDGHELLAFTEG